MRFVLAGIFALHGLIHFLGVVAAVKPESVPQLTRYLIPLPPRVQLIGWAVAGALFVASAVVVAMNESDWWHLVGIATVASQVMIVTAWPDAKFGTIANVIALVVVIVFGALERFDHQAEQVMHELKAKVPTTPGLVVQSYEVERLPAPISRWLTAAGVVGKRRVSWVTLEQEGELRVKPDGAWSPVSAHQVFSVDPPGFAWHAEVSMVGGFPVRGLDRFVDGKGRMQISLLGLVPMVDLANERIDEGTLIRWLGELVFFPSAALSPLIAWEAIDAQTARARLTFKGITGSVVFTIDELGRFKSMEAMRYFGGGPEAKRERWFIPATSWRRIDGVEVPIAGEVTWMLAGGDFTYYRWRILDVQTDEQRLPSVSDRPRPSGGAVPELSRRF